MAVVTITLGFKENPYGGMLCCAFDERMTARESIDFMSRLAPLKDCKIQFNGEMLVEDNLDAPLGQFTGLNFDGDLRIWAIAFAPTEGGA